MTSHSNNSKSRNLVAWISLSRRSSIETQNLPPRNQKNSFSINLGRNHGVQNTLKPVKKFEEI